MRVNPDVVPYGACLAHGCPAAMPGSSAVSMDDNDAAIEQELDMLMAKAGVELPAERRAGVIAGYKDMKRVAALLRQSRTAADETSNIFRLTGFMQSNRT